MSKQFEKEEPLFLPKFDSGTENVAVSEALSNDADDPTQRAAEAL